MKFRILTLSLKGLFATFSIMTLSIMTLSITTLSHYAECHYGECRVLFIVMLNVVMPVVIMLSVVAPLQYVASENTLAYLSKLTQKCFKTWV